MENLITTFIISLHVFFLINIRVSYEAKLLPFTDALYMMQHQHKDTEKRLFVVKSFLDTEKARICTYGRYYSNVFETEQVQSDFEIFYYAVRTAKEIAALMQLYYVV